MEKLTIFLVILVSILIWLCVYLLKKLVKLSYQKRSLSVKYGKTSEQFMPFLVNYPYDSEKFRFIGNPIDGIQFEDDKVIFIEFKTEKSKLNQNQKKIKEIIENKRVGFEEFRI